MKTTEEREAQADSLISLKTRDAVLREIADGTIAEGIVLDVVKALVRRIDRKEAARASKNGGEE